MFSLPQVLTAGALGALATAGPVKRQDEEYVGYLMTTFIDALPQAHWHLSQADDPLNFTALNGGDPVLVSDVGTGGVRDMFLATNTGRSEYFMLATDLDIRVPDFNWDDAGRHGSHSLVIWSSTNLVDWSAPQLTKIELDTGGMAWAPSAVWDDEEGRYYLFWATRLFSEDDPNHTGEPSLERIRYSTTPDFVTFSDPQDYYAPEDTALIDQEFQYLGTPGSYLRYVKNAKTGQILQEQSSDGIFGSWTEAPGYLDIAEATQYEGAASFADISTPGRYHLLLDNYDEYVPFTTDNILAGGWEKADAPGFPDLLKHGCVTPVTQEEYDAIAEKYL